MTDIHEQKLFAPNEPDNRSFEEMMGDLGVEVVKRKGEELKNIKWVSGWEKINSLADKVKINKSSVSFGDEVLKVLFEGSVYQKLRLAVADFRKQKVLVIKPSKTGYAIVRGKTGRSFAFSNSPGVMRKLREYGLALGVYRVQKAKGGIICIPEEEKER